MIVPAVLTGGVIGAGLLLGAHALLNPRPPRLDRRLVELHEPPAIDGLDAARARWQQWGLRALGVAGADLVSLRRDLEVCEIALERHAVAKLGGALGGAVVPVLVASIWTVAGIVVAPAAVVVASLVLAAAGFFVPDRILARRAAERRREFRYALALYLELVVIVLASGGGVTTAMHDAAETGSGWAFAQIRRTLETSRLKRLSPWAGLRDLAERIGSPELEGLASSVELAGTSGARVRESLRAKAVSVRDHELSETEAEALAASERMGGPMVGMFVGLILLIGYPAIVTVMRL